MLENHFSDVHCIFPTTAPEFVHIRLIRENRRLCAPIIKYIEEAKTTISFYSFTSKFDCQHTTMASLKVSPAYTPLRVELKGHCKSLQQVYIVAQVGLASLLRCREYKPLSIGQTENSVAHKLEGKLQNILIWENNV